jgi:hypothetical protein
MIRAAGHGTSAAACRSAGPARCRFSAAGEEASPCGPCPHSGRLSAPGAARWPASWFAPLSGSRSLLYCRAGRAIGSAGRESGRARLNRCAAHRRTNRERSLRGCSATRIRACRSDSVSSPAPYARRTRSSATRRVSSRLLVSLAARWAAADALLRWRPRSLLSAPRRKVSASRSAVPTGSQASTALCSWLAATFACIQHRRASLSAASKGLRGAGGACAWNAAQRTNGAIRSHRISGTLSTQSAALPTIRHLSNLSMPSILSS